MLDLYLIRHAESEMNTTPHLIGGRSNETPLSLVGEYQARLLGERLKRENIQFDKIYSSTARRTQDTAKIALKIICYPLEEIVTSEELLELSQGDWEGKPREELYTPELISRIESDNWNFTPPNGESQRIVEERMMEYIRKNMLKEDYTNKCNAIFGHGMAIKCLLRGMFQFSPSITYKLILDNTSITRIQYTRKGWKLITINDREHLR